MCIERPLAGPFRGAPAHRYRGSAVAHRHADRPEQVTQIIAGGFDQNNIGFRSYGVGPLDVERCFHSPGGIGGRLSRGRINFAEAAVVGSAGAQVELLVENAEVGFDVGIDDANSLPRALIGDGIKTVSMPNLGE